VVCGCVEGRVGEIACDLMLSGAAGLYPGRLFCPIAGSGSEDLEIGELSLDSPIVFSARRIPPLAKVALKSLD
jgi:hypothetical protein